MATKNAWGSDFPAQVAYGGTGRGTLTDGTLLLGNGTDPVEMLSLAKGSLVAGTSTVAQEHTVGTNNFVLAADSTKATGLDWKSISSLGGVGGSWQWVSTTTLSSDTTIEFTNITGSGAKFVWYNLLSSVDNSDIYITASNDGGMVWSPDYYQYGFKATYANSSTQTKNDTQASEWQLNNGVTSLGNAAGEYGSTGTLEVYSLNDPSNPVWGLWHMVGHATTSGEQFYNTGGANTAEKNNAGQVLDVDSIRFSLDHGIFASGTMIQYKLVIA
jgi:hypothetical protein